MGREFPDVQFAMPTLEPWHKALIGGLLAAYVVELLLALAGVPIHLLLPWWNFDGGFAPWQPLTHFLVQGPGGEAVLRVVLSLLMLYFFLPMVERAVDRRQLGFAMLAGAAGGIGVATVMDAAGLASAGPALGWSPLVFALPALFGIARPDETILLLLFPVKARWVLWGTLGVAMLFVLADHNLGSYQGVGVWLGVFGWWHLLGPGARRRRLVKQASGIERQLKIRVIEGGKSKPQGRQGDEWVN